MFREVHRGIRHLNQFLRRRAVNRESGDAETGRDIFVAQQRVGRDPSAKFSGQLARLFH